MTGHGGDANDGGNRTLTNFGPGSGTSCIGGIAFGRRTSECSASMTHLRSMFALRLCASATAAMDTPGFMHSAITEALYSALCRRGAASPSNPRRKCPCVRAS